MTAIRETGGDFLPEPDASASLGGDGRGGAGIRLARLETRITRLAAKEDLRKIKVWVMGGAVGAAAVGATLAVGISKLLG